MQGRIVTPLGTKIYRNSKIRFIDLGNQNKFRISTGVQGIISHNTGNFDIYLKPISTSKACKLDSCYISGPKKYLKAVLAELINTTKCYSYTGNPAEAVLESFSRGIDIKNPELLDKISVLPIFKK